MSRMQFSLADIRILAKSERDMSAGTQPFVLNHGLRFAFPGEVLKHLGIETGQDVSDTLLIEIMQANILDMRRKMEMEGNDD